VAKVPFRLTQELGSHSVDHSFSVFQVTALSERGVQDLTVRAKGEEKICGLVLMWGGFF
jgi:hypothetical protein